MLDAGQGLLQLFSCLFVADGFQGPGFGFGQEDTFDGLGIKGLVTKGMMQGPVDVISVVGCFEVKDGAGMEAAVSRVGLLEPGQEGRGCVSEGKESLSDGFQTVADLF